MTALRLAYVVPTMDRPDDLEKLLTSLRAQTVKPHQIIIVDGSDPDIKPVCDSFADQPITYVRCFPPSLAKQRNAGMSALAKDITVAGYLDDDLVLEPDATEQMIAFWEKAGPETGGASFSVINQGNVHHDRLLRLFQMHGDPPGRVLPSGHACFIPFVTETVETQWLYGGATLWRREAIREFSYDEWYIGHGFLEDLDYSYRVSRKYRLFVVGSARTWHFARPMADSKQYELGRQQVFNRLYFIRKMDSFSMPAVAWGLFGLLALNLLAVLRHPAHKPTRRRLAGNLVGLVAALRGRKQSFEGHWK